MGTRQSTDNQSQAELAVDSTPNMIALCTQNTNRIKIIDLHTQTSYDQFDGARLNFEECKLFYYKQLILFLVAGLIAKTTTLGHM